jgi:membrane protein YdbS with pleckstrin-like domain
VILRKPAQQLDRRVQRLWAAEALGAALVVALLVAGATVLAAATWSLGGAILVGVLGGAAALALALAGALVVPGIAYDRYRYEVTELGLYVERGRFWRHWQVVPHARVQTVDVESGPLLRAFGLVEVRVTTASSDGGTGIPGLAPDVADRLVHELARRADVVEGT